jgi:hypothetical protein
LEGRNGRREFPEVVSIRIDRIQLTVGVKRVLYMNVECTECSM